jgi:hypothetical protein
LNDIETDYTDDRAMNEYDTEMIQTTGDGKKKRMIDADGDGVEDNIKHSHWELDKFNKPMVYGVAVWDMHNTHNGELPGHVRFGEGHEPGTNPWAEADAKDAKIAKAKADAKKAQDKVANVDLLELNDIETDYTDDRAMNEYDTEMIQTTGDGKKKRMIDADGDGVEDNIKHSHWELDKFNKPMVYGVAVWDMHNTHNGELPGHVRFGEGHEPGTNPWAEADAKDAKIAKAKADAKKAQDKVANVDLLELNDIETDYTDDRAMNEYDTEMIQTTGDGKKKRIIDADGDGVEDNIKHSHWELDKFNKPMVYGVAVWDMHNTHNGELPGHVRFGEGHEPGTNPWAEADAKDAKIAKAKADAKAKQDSVKDVELA